MKTIPSQFSRIFILILFVSCTFIMQKTVAIKQNNKLITILTYNRTVKDVLIAQSIYLDKNRWNQPNLLIPLREGMVIEITSDQIIKLD